MTHNQTLALAFLVGAPTLAVVIWLLSGPFDQWWDRRWAIDWTDTEADPFAATPIFSATVAAHGQSHPAATFARMVDKIDACEEGS